MDTVVYQDLEPPIWGRYIRFRPITFNKHVSMRVELFGCLKGIHCSVIIPVFIFFTFICKKEMFIY